jgi:hypothetical protein
MLLKHGRKVPMIVLRDLFNLKGYQTFLEALEHLPGPIESCVKILKDNDDLLAVYPGGLDEGTLIKKIAFFSLLFKLRYIFDFYLKKKQFYQTIIMDWYGERMLALLKLPKLPEWLVKLNQS